MRLTHLATLLLVLVLASAAHAGTYVVKSGDSLSKLAQRFGTSVEAIQHANGMQANETLIVIGQTLEIPPQNIEPTPAVEDRVYHVRPGDTLSDIGIKFGIPYGRIKVANGLHDNTIFPGQRLVIPGIPKQPDEGIPLDIVVLPATVVAKVNVPTPTLPKVTAEPHTSNGSLSPAPLEQDPEPAPQEEATTPEPFYHGVVPGDTLGKLATKYRTTVEAIMSLNGLTNRNVITVGQRLRIPNKEAVDPRQFYVQHPAMTATTAERTALARLIQSEVPESAPFEGAVAVAAVVLNRVRSSIFPDDIVGVVAQRGYDRKRKRWVYQFSGYNDARYKAPVRDYAWAAADQALRGVDPTGGSDHYYNPFLVTPRWARQFEFVRRIGTTSETAHDFYRPKKGGVGIADALSLGTQAAAFGDLSGGE